MKHASLSITLASTLIVVAPHIGATPVPKQLAGPPSEFALMSEPDPQTRAIHSKSAMIPVQLREQKGGLWQWQTTLPVESSDFRFIAFTGAADDWHLSLRAPGSVQRTAVDTLAVDKHETLYGIENNQFPADYYGFASATPGAWTLTVEAPSAKQTEGFILLNNAGPYRLRSYQRQRNQRVGERIGFIAHAYSLAKGAQVDVNADVEVAADVLSDAYIQIKSPDGNVWTEPMFDDGLHGDQLAGDGIFGGDFLAGEAGNYHAQVIASGQTDQGAPLLRTAEHLVPVVESNISLASQFAVGDVVSDKRMMVNLALNGEGVNDHYRVHAQVWGTSAKDGRTAVPVAWIGGMVNVQDNTLNVGLDARWIALAGARAPFELRNLRIEDPNHFIPLVRAPQLALETPALPLAASRAVTAIDDEMIMGPRPPQDNVRAGSRLLLVHGYCSGNAWGQVAGQFSGESIFADFNQNRSHDLFARLIWSFGSVYSSYGIVAHSQGGAASMHLYAYYFSGLDYAGPGRLIQSVGTPYQGTSLAGNLAALGDIFGVGCGANTDLTYSGAAAWLSGIPSFARAATNYYTTSFTDDFFSYDYCHLGSDLLLNDPDDGTTERERGQVSGAINRGHVTGWCHTTGMRDPAQYLDSGRNSVMNSAAAR